jgi:hypothetical protein
MVFENSFDAHKDFQQLRDLKCRNRAKKKDKPTATNIADEMLHVLEMVKDHPFDSHGKPYRRLLCAEVLVLETLSGH